MCIKIFFWIKVEESESCFNCIECEQCKSNEMHTDLDIFGMLGKKLQK